MPPVSTRKSRLAGASCKSILYCNPEQPPPTTATRSTPLGRPCLVSNEPTFDTAPAVSLIRRSSPVRNTGEPTDLIAELAIIERSKATEKTANFKLQSNAQKWIVKMLRPFTLPLNGSRTMLSSEELFVGGPTGLIKLTGFPVFAASMAIPLTRTLPMNISSALDSSGEMGVSKVRDNSVVNGGGE